MSLLKRNKNSKTTTAAEQASLAELVLKTIHDGVIITDKSGAIQFINPAASTMTDCGNLNNVIGLDYGFVVKLESKEGRELSDAENPLINAIKTGQPLENYHGSLVVGSTDKRVPIAINVLPTEGLGGQHVITFRNIAKELEEEGATAEFVSTASHEMRTPVASIEGYLSLALNPQTATIDARARGYLDAAHAASQHLGKLFQDLLDATKLDDGKVKANFEPVEMVGAVKTIADEYIQQAKDAGLTLRFGTSDVSLQDNRRLNQVVYGYVDLGFLREIVTNLIENAIKYTPSGGSIYVNASGDGDRVLINVTDTGIGISAEDLTHIFQKFYRADNSQTRTVGGTGLGLYLVKQRVEAMGGRVWAESAFGEGSTFYVSLPRITGEEYEKRMIAVKNKSMMNALRPPAPVAPNMPMSPVIPPVPPVPPAQPVPAASVVPTAPTAQPVAPPAQPVPPTPPAPPTGAPNEVQQPQQNNQTNGGTNQ